MEPTDLGTKGPWIPSGDHPLFEGTRRSTGRNTPRVKNCLAPQERCIIIITITITIAIAVTNTIIIYNNHVT